MNKVILIGRLTRDPELRTTASNLSVIAFSLAVPKNFSSQNGTSDADFINCVAWRGLAENIAKFCKKGNQIAVEGHIQTRSYTAQDGTKRYVTEVVCENVLFLSPKNSNNEGIQSVNNSSDNDFFANNNNIDSTPTTDISEDPFKDFGEEITLSDDDLPF